MTKIKPTDEQLEIIEESNNVRVLKVNAVAGSGKTATLRMLTGKHKLPSLYVCFNKSIKEEAESKFPSHVTCRTTHSLAFARFGADIKHKLNRPRNWKVNCGKTGREVSQLYNIKPFECKDGTLLNEVTLGVLVTHTVNRFESSADDEVGSRNIPYGEINDLSKHHNFDKGALKRVVLKYAGMLWEDRKDPYSDVLATHDTYLKLWQLSRPKLDYDIIYLDEAQDTSPVVLDVLQRQTHCKIVYVGDTYQSIYQFRGAVNAMEMIEAPSKTLSKSFRYGTKIADLATDIIQGKVKVKGNQQIQSEIKTVDQKQPFTYIFRTNGALFSEAVKLVQQGHSVFCDVNVKDFLNKVKSARALKEFDMKKVKHSDIVFFPTFNDLLVATEEDRELKRIVDIATKSKAQYNNTIKALEGLESKKDANIHMTTAHKSKGCEWSNVIISNDFPVKTGDFENSPFEDMSDQERNLFYVACTRAVNVLELPEQLVKALKETIN